MQDPRQAYYISVGSEENSLGIAPVLASSGRSEVINLGCDVGNLRDARFGYDLYLFGILCSPQKW